MYNCNERLEVIREAALKQKKLQVLAADGSLKGTTVAYEMAKQADVILRELSKMAGRRTIFCRCVKCNDEREYIDEDGIRCAVCNGGPLRRLRVVREGDKPDE